MTFLTALPRHPNQGEDPWFAPEEAWKDGVETNLGELESHAETHDALTSHVPTGGTTGQTLVKNSNTNWDLIWAAPSGGGVTDHGALTGLTDPDHPIGAVTGLQAALDSKAATSHTHSYDALGAADAAVAAHVALGDPHTQYLTPAEGTAAYAPIASKVPVGGTTGQVLAKTGSGDYAMAWSAPAGGVTSPLVVTATADTQTPISSKAFSATQSANLFEARLSDNTVYWTVEADQEMKLGPNVTAQNGTFRLGISNAARVGALVKMAALQSAKPVLVTDSANVEKFSVDKDGVISGLNLAGTFGIVGGIVLNAVGDPPAGLPDGTLIFRRPA